MVRLREIPRTAAFAWSTGVSPRIVTGTKAGAVSADFSDDTALEVWDLDLSEPSVELQPTARVNIDSRFHAIAWSQPTKDRSQGLIAGALESGSLDLWDAETLGTSSKPLARIAKHSGAIKSLQFNPKRDDMLASAGAKGELYITNLNNPSTDPLRLGTSAARADDFDALDWNKKVPHILVTGSSGGFATVWDIKAKKESINLNNFNRKAISAIAWDPTTATKLATATSYDQEPVILLWDLRNSNAPEKILRHHDQGVLSLSWSIADPRLLLSCGKDNRTVCWNTQTGEPFGEFPIVTNWTFETSWSPRHPGLFATASFDGKIAIQTIQNTNPDTSAATATAALDDNDFFASAQSRPQGASFSLPIAPTWLQRPVSATFGFGGKLVKVSSEGGRSKVSISTFVVDSSIGKASDEFEKTVADGDFKSFCDLKIADAKTGDEKADWTVIETLISGSRKNLKEYLGFKENAPKENGDIGLKDNEDEDFFDKSDDIAFASAWSASKTTKTNDPFKLYTGKESESDKKISRALVLGNFEDALDVCLKEKRMSDAFMIAISGGEKCIAKAKAAYFKSASDGPNYLRLLASVSSKNLWDLVYNADLKDWKELMLVICTYADEAEFPDLCEALGDRLEENTGDKSASHKDASFCYLSGSKLEKVVTLWLQELEESEKSLVDHAEGGSSLFSIHANALQAFIEKVTIFRNVTGFADSETNKEDNWKLAPLYAKYTEYADILASQGQLATAAKYLDFLPTYYPAADVARNRVQHATRKVAAASTQKQVAGGTSRGQKVVGNFPSAVVPGIPAATAVNSMYAPPNSTQPAFTQLAARPAYGGGAYQPPQSYQPQGYQPPAATMPTPQPFASYNQYGVGSGAGVGVPPPPRASNQSPAVPPASKASNLESWNDTPDFGIKPVPRRSTPSVVTAPVAGSQHASSPAGFPPPSAIGAGSYGAPPPSKHVAPPPKTGMSRTTSPGIVPVIPSIQDQASQAAISRAANTYSPPPSLHAQPMQPSIIPRGASPYNPPPPGQHGTNNRYAPAPGSFQPGPPKPSSSPYAPRQPPAGGPGYMQPPPSAVRHELPGVTTPVGGPPPGPPPKGTGRTMAPPPVSTAGGRGISLPSPQPSTSRPGSSGSNRPESTPKYPPGDRSHISGPLPSEIYHTINSEMQRVKARAPSSYKDQVLEVERRVNVLFDHLNSSAFEPATLGKIKEMADSLGQREHEEATKKVTELMKIVDGGQGWLVGVKRLVVMSKATPI